MQLLRSLLAGLKAVCATFPGARKGRGGNIEISDFGVSAFSMFFMQSASFLAYQRGLEKGQVPRDNQGENGATIWMRMPLRGCRREGVALPSPPTSQPEEDAPG